MSDTPTPGQSRWSAIYEAMTGATSAQSHHHEAATGTNPESLKAGHEPDHFDAKGIIMVPVLVVAVTAAVYVLVTVLFGQFEFGAPIKGSQTHDVAAAEGAKSFNERAAAISSTDPHAKFQEPRLESIPNLDTSRNGKTDDPPYLRSFPKADTGNTALMTPQDLQPERYIDPATGKKVLVGYDYVNKEKGVARIPIADAMKQLVGKLPAKKAGTNSSTTTGAKQSNGGQAIDAK